MLYFENIGEYDFYFMTKLAISQQGYIGLNMIRETTIITFAVIAFLIATPAMGISCKALAF